MMRVSRLLVRLRQLCGLFLLLSVTLYLRLWNVSGGSGHYVDINDVWLWGSRKDVDISRLSNLGKKLFFGYSGSELREQNRTFRILVWKHGLHLSRWLLPHRRAFNDRIDPFEDCSVHNCVLAYKDDDIIKADAVLFHLHRMKSPSELPRTRLAHQRWIFMMEENPINIFFLSRHYKMLDYNGVFNWSMSYRMDSDVPIPYGRTVPFGKGESPTLLDPLVNKTSLVAIMGSNCHGDNGRWDYVRELMKYLVLDTYGRCGQSSKCRSRYFTDCPELVAYKFYLAFENGNCHEYVTEKLWWNAFQKFAVPVVMGAQRNDYEKLLPPRSFIHVDDFPTPKDLAAYLRYLDDNDEQYQLYHEWRKSHKILNEHGYFGSPVHHYCRVCEALNYNDNQPKTYSNLEETWGPYKNCFKSNWKLRYGTHESLFN